MAAWTEADITQVQDAIRALTSGRPIQDYQLSDGRRTTYMRLSELRDLLSEMQGAVAAETAGSSMHFSYVHGRRTR